MRGRQRKNKILRELAPPEQRAEELLRSLRESAAVRIGAELRELGWSQAEASKQLQITQPRLSDIVRGKAHTFTLDGMVEVLCRLGVPVRLVYSATALEYEEAQLADAEAMVVHCTQQWEGSWSSIRWLVKRARSYQELGRYQKALDDLHYCVMRQPDQPWLREARAGVYLAMCHYWQGVQECEALLKLFPYYDCYVTYARLLWHLGRRDQAFSALDRAVAMRPNSPNGLLYRARFHQWSAHHEAAVRDYRGVLRLDPMNREALLALQHVDEEGAAGKHDADADEGHVVALVVGDPTGGGAADEVAEVHAGGEDGRGPVAA